jgi:hypothetical protein
MPPDLKMTRTYYWTWQACSLCAALAAGAGTYLVLRFSFGELGFVGGVVVGACMASAWNDTKWKDDR